MKRNLILSVLDNYNYPIAEPFIQSLRTICYNGDLVIFVSNTITSATKRALNVHGATLIEYKGSYPFITGGQEIFADIARSITINNYRFLLYLKFLQENKDQYENIMLTDIRDVIFQKNIFDLIQNNKIYFFLEDQTQTFRTSKLNYDWSLDANGPEVTTQIIDNTVSCAGIVIGNTMHVIAYLNYMRSKFKHRGDLDWGLDQGIHNEYVYTVSNNAAVIIENTSPLIYTLGACTGYKQDSNGALLNENGEIYAVVHQYDRFGTLLVYFKKKFIGNYLIQVLKKILYKLLP